MPVNNRVADFVVRRLIEAGVDHFFLLTGGNVMHLDDAIRLSGIPFTAFHHEQSATMAAEAYARVSGKLSCVVVTSGPGATNVVTGVAGAFYDSVPMIVVCGNAKNSDLRKEGMPHGVRQVGTFELPIHEVCKTISKFSALINSVNEVKLTLDTAIEESISGRPGPSVINVPLDIQGEVMPNHAFQHIQSLPKRVTLPNKSDDVDLSKLVQALQKSSRPAVLVGHGVRVSGSSEKLLNLLKDINLPIFTTQLAKDFVPYADDLFIGHFGVRGDRPGNIGIHKADLILCIGTSLHQQNIGYEPQLFAPEAEKFVVELEGSVSGKKLDIEANFLEMTIQDFVKRFSSEIDGFVKTNSPWLDELRVLKHKYAVNNEPHDFSTSDLNMYEFVESLSKCLDGHETIITDAGLCFYIMGQAFKLKNGQRYIVSGGLGSMGYALPAAIGASILKQFPVIAVTGDGSMQMNVQELATLSLLGTKTKIFVINNAGYASIRNTQRSFFGEELIGASELSGLSMPDWSLIAASYGINHVAIRNSSELRKLLPKIIKNNKVQLIEIFCQQNQVVMPGVGNYRDETGNLRSNPLFEMKPTISESFDGINLIIN